MRSEPEFQEDPRYKQAHKEALIGLAIFIFNIVWWFAFAYGLGSGAPAEYSYVFGFPAWFFWAVIVNYIFFSLIVWVAVSFFFKEVPLETEETVSNSQRREEEE